MTYAILQISAAAYGDIRDRIVAIDAKLRINEYVRTYIRPGDAAARRPEHIVFGPIGLEALPPAPAAEDPLEVMVRNLQGLHDYVEGAERQAVLLAASEIVESEIARRAGVERGKVTLSAPLHVDYMNDAVLVGLALEDDARAMWGAMGLPETWDAVKDKPAGARILAAAKIMRIRYLTAEREATLLAAARWRALSAAAPRLIGCAGFEFADPGTTFDDGSTIRPTPSDNGYMHAGFEFWTRAGVKWVERGRNGSAAKVLTMLADQIIAQGGECWAMEDGKRVERGAMDHDHRAEPTQAETGEPS